MVTPIVLRTLRAVVAGMSVTLAACGGTGTSPSGSGTSPTPTPVATNPPVPVLSVAAVDLALVNDFLPFGYVSSGRVNPAYELRTSGEGAPVRAASPGTVVGIRDNPVEGDSEIEVSPPNASGYALIYDHVLALEVATGQTVAAGQVLGRVGRFIPGVGRTELQVNRTSGGSTVALCPRDFGTAEFNAAHDAAFARFPARGASVCLASSVVP